MGPNLGGETSDFWHPPPAVCDERREPLSDSDDSVTGFPASTVLEFVRGEHTVDAYWEEGDVTTTGHAAETSLRLSVEVGDVQRVRRSKVKPEPIGIGSYACNDGIVFQAKVKLETADGALLAEVNTADGEVVWEQEARIDAQIDLRSAYGTLEVDLDTSLPSSVQLVVSLRFLPEQTRGNIVPRVAILHGGSEGPSFADGASLQFPKDACDPDTRPVGASDPLPEAGGRTLTQLLADARRSVSAMGPLDAAWDGAPSTQIEFTLGESESGCLRYFPYGSEIGILLPVSLTTADGRLRYRDDTGGSLSVQRDGSLSGISLENVSGEVPAANIEEVFGISGLAFDAPGCGALSYGLSFGTPDFVFGQDRPSQGAIGDGDTSFQAYGRVELFSYPQCDGDAASASTAALLRVCSQSPCPVDIRPSF